MEQEVLPGWDIAFPQYGRPLDQYAEGQYHRPGTTGCTSAALGVITAPAEVEVTVSWALFLNPSWVADLWAPSLSLICLLSSGRISWRSHLFLGQ